MGSAILGGVVGFLFGIVFAVMRRAWSDYQKIKASVPGLRKAAWAHIRNFALWCAGIAAVVIVFGAYVASAADKQDHPRPASVVSPSPSPSPHHR